MKRNVPKINKVNSKNTWYIMSAYGWINGRPSIEKIIKENDSNGTIIVAKRDGVKTFILGSRGDYGKIGQQVHYIQDTGNGYGKEGYCEIENIITIDKEKIINPGNEIGLNEKRTLWVFK